MQFIDQFISKLNQPKTYLFLANFLLVFFLILLSNLGILPVKSIGDFLFFTFLFLFFALYRPGWAFLFFIGTVALENINMAPLDIGISVRPYQFLGGLIIAALTVRLILKRLNFSLPKLRWPDYLVAILAVTGFLSAFTAADKNLSLKMAVIFASFVFLYFLIRVFIDSLDDLKKIIPFFISSSAVLVLYGIWQNIRFMKGLSPFETMPGRPNATFAEADWLGIYLVLVMAVVYAVVIYFSRRIIENQSPQIFNFQFSISKFQIFQTFLYLFLVLVYALLIITVSRSAWLGALAATFVFLFLVLTNLKANPKNWQWKYFFSQLAFIAIAIIFSYALVYAFNLTNFQLLNRVQSTGTGLQKITISCAPGAEAPERVDTIEGLEKFSCRYINLEDIEKEMAEGNVVKEIYRTDPNISIRSEIYKKSWEQIKAHPILGIGWGSISNILGKDARGAGLNASNIFLEVWLGAGMTGIAAFLALWLYVLARGVLNFLKAVDPGKKSFSVFVITSWFGLTFANLFNSGIMLGFLWLFLAISLINLQPDENRD